MNKRWLLAKIKPGRWQWAVENIQRQGCNFYLPRIAVTKVIGRVYKTTIAQAEALFPGYIFVETDGQWQFLLSTYGVAGVVLTGESPSVVPPRLIADLKSREVNGLVILPALDPKGFREGQKLRVKSGSFEGRQGIYQGMAPRDCCRVLLDVMGRRTPVLIRETLLEVA